MEIGQIKLVVLGGSLGKCTGNDNGVNTYATVAKSSWRRIEPYTKTGHQAFSSYLPNLMKPVIDKIGPGGIIADDIATFNLDTPNPGSIVESAQALAVHAFKFGRRFNKADPRAARDTPLVFDTGVRSGLSPFKYKFWVIINLSRSMWKVLEGAVPSFIGALYWGSSKHVVTLNSSSQPMTIISYRLIFV